MFIGLQGSDRWPPSRYWISLGAALLGCKALLYLLDPLPMFYMGDSGAYIATALDGYMPPDRSFRP